MSKTINRILKQKISFTLNADRNVLAAVGLYFSALSLFEIFHLQTDYSTFFEYLNQSPINFLICGVYLIVSFYLTFIFILATVSSKWRYKFIYLTIFTVAMFAEYGYQKALGRFTNFNDVIEAISATDEQRLHSLFAFTNPLALLPCLGLLLLCIFLKKNSKQFGGKILGVLLFSISLFYLHLSYVNQLFFDHQFTGVSFSYFCQTTADYFLNEPVIKLAPVERERVEIPNLGENYRPANNIIFIFDESIKGNHLSLNGYSRPTTPYLEDLAARKLLINWGIAAAGSTSSHPSYNSMIIGASPDLLENRNRREIDSMPTLFQYAKAMNYRTHLFDGQMKNYWGGMPEDLNYIDNFVSLSHLDNPNRVEDWELIGKTIRPDVPDSQLEQWKIDTKIAKLVNEVFSNSTGNFVFIYKRGNHFPYEKNYPADETFWNPVYHFKGHYEIPPADKYESIVNSYDNSIRYNLDRFFKTLTPNYLKLANNTVILYTADHGESFFINGKAGHGGTTREEAAVPLFLLGNTGNEFDTEFKASHCNIFTTLLDLMYYPENLRKHPYSLSLLKAKKADSKPRFYNPQLGKKLPFD